MLVNKGFKLSLIDNKIISNSIIKNKPLLLKIVRNKYEEYGPQSFDEHYLDSHLKQDTKFHLRHQRFNNKLKEAFPPLYPFYKKINYQARDSYGKWDIPQLKRNYNEPIGVNGDILDVWAPEIYPYDRKLILKSWGLFLGALGSIFAAIFLIGIPQTPAAKKGYPEGGLYTALGGSEEEKEIFAAREDKL